ncbi:hypothetical protein RchiOBHm_Chr3g0448541 [Rosa chinensis]|uniref:Transmembrane protein n=1 Tax=Rosa chinensis TaxID=74649 RepID=A0A2P6R594_ROSCH|nr:hypothetical protein RchiOBHm_Chr3g0448541 [Rosa chinensis]
MAKPLSREQRTEHLFRLVPYVVFLASSYVLYPPEWCLEAAKDNKHVTLILVLDYMVSAGLAYSLFKLKTLITSDLLCHQLMMIHLGFISTYVAALFFLSFTSVPKLHHSVRVAVAVATSLVLWRLKFVEENDKSLEDSGWICEVI